ncbi:MAG: hypothetical protein ACYTGP_03450, partial [Planctomycetota bacterium]
MTATNRREAIQRNPRSRGLGGCRGPGGCRALGGCRGLGAAKAAWMLVAALLTLPLTGCADDHDVVLYVSADE